MMDFSLEEDIPEEFKGTLTLNNSNIDDKQTPTQDQATVVEVVDNANQITKNNNSWSSGFIAAIPQCSK